MHLTDPSFLPSMLNAAASDIGDERMAFLALTSKPELQVRDALAWQMHRQLGERHRVVREWRRTDLAVLSRSGSPELLIEAKALYTFDALDDVKRSQYLGYLASDHAKASKLATPDTAIVLLAIVTHVADPVPEDLRDVVKYWGSINRWLGRHESDYIAEGGRTVLKSDLKTLGSPVVHIPMTDGSTFGIQCSTSAYIVG